MTVYGYARVSSMDQNEDRQMVALKNAGVPDDNVYLDKMSGKDFERPAYKQLLRKLKKDDVIYIKTRWESKEITGTAAAKECGMPLSSFRRRAAIYSGKEADRPCP